MAIGWGNWLLTGLFWFIAIGSKIGFEYYAVWKVRSNLLCSPGDATARAPKTPAQMGGVSC